MAIQRTKEGYDAWYYGNRKTFSSLAEAKAYEKKLKKKGKPRNARRTGNQSSRSRQVISRKKSSSNKSRGSSSQISDAQRQNFYDQLLSIRETLAGLQQKQNSKKPSYTGNSIEDYLRLQGQDYSFGNRSKLAQQYGISNYAGTAAQNTQLLNTLRGGSVSSNSGPSTRQAIPSTVAASGLSKTDVEAKRRQLEEIKGKALSIQDQLDRLSQVAEGDPFELVTDTGEVNNNPLSDPDTLIARYFNNNDYSQAEKERDRLLGQISDTTSEYYKSREDELRNAYREYGVDKKTENLAKIQKEMADRQVRMREDIKGLETNAEFRGVSREFANDQREQIKSVGAFDMANLAIVESAYAGDLDRSRELAQELVDNQFNAFTGQIETYKAQLTALMPQLNEEQKKRALGIEIALDERARKIAQAKEDTELKYEYATLAAEMNAPLEVTRSILNATSADEAFMMAAPYMSEKNTISDNYEGVRPGSSISPFHAPLSEMDITSSKTTNRDLENAIRGQFAPDFASNLFTSMTQEQVRDFMARYDQIQRDEQANIDPGIFGNAYLYSLGKTPNLPVSLPLPPGSFEIDAEDRIRAEDTGKYEIRRVGDRLYAIPKTEVTTSSSGERDPY